MQTGGKKSANINDMSATTAKLFLLDYVVKTREVKWST